MKKIISLISIITTVLCLMGCMPRTKSGTRISVQGLGDHTEITDYVIDIDDNLYLLDDNNLYINGELYDKKTCGIFAKNDLVYACFDEGCGYQWSYYENTTIIGEANKRPKENEFILEVSEYTYHIFDNEIFYSMPSSDESEDGYDYTIRYENNIATTGNESGYMAYPIYLNNQKIIEVSCGWWYGCGLGAYDKGGSVGIDLKEANKWYTNSFTIINDKLILLIIDEGDLGPADIDNLIDLSYFKANYLYEIDLDTYEVNRIYESTSRIVGLNDNYVLLLEDNNVNKYNYLTNELISTTTIDDLYDYKDIYFCNVKNTIYVFGDGKLLTTIDNTK